MKNKNGQILPIALILLTMLAIITPAIITWLQQESKSSIRGSQMSRALNLASAGVDRGTWKLQSSTATWTAAALGTVITGYNFDTTYTDVDGGTYRVKFSSGPSTSQVTIYAEGRDTTALDVRAIKAIYKNQTIYSALMTGGNISWSAGLAIFWGPIIAQGNITLKDDVVGVYRFPRKYAKGVVISTGTYPRDTNGLTPPNTDNLEWWSDYPGIPAVPALDFATLRSSAIATGTFNVYGCKLSTAPVGAWDIRATCSSAGNHNSHFGNPWNHPKSAKNQPNTDYVWYWDGDVTFAGGTNPNESCGIRGTIIVRGNLIIDSPGEYSYTGHVPSTAWQEHQRITSTQLDTNSSGEYPADTGLNQNGSTFGFGSQTFCLPTGLNTRTCGIGSTVGMRGFVYVGGNMTMQKYMDVHGALWVNGNITAVGGSATQGFGVYYDDTLIVPALNVILLKVSWQENTPSTIAWAP